MDHIGALNLEIFPNTAMHVLEQPDPLPLSGDPFDVSLLAQCQIEGMQAATADRALVTHPPALKF